MATPQTLPAAGPWKLRAPRGPTPRNAHGRLRRRPRGGLHTAQASLRGDARAPPASRPAFCGELRPLRVPPAAASALPAAAHPRRPPAEKCTPGPSGGRGLRHSPGRGEPGRGIAAQDRRPGGLPYAASGTAVRA